MDKLKKEKGEAVLITTYIGFGDLLYQTPLIKWMSRFFKGGVDVWCYNTEPFENNPHINKLFKIENNTVPDPSDIYFDNVFYLSPNMNSFIARSLYHHNHPVDVYSQGLFGIKLRDDDAGLVYEAKVDKKFFEKMKNLNIYKNSHTNTVVINPSVTWPSRTLPLEAYQELIGRILERGDQVVLVGKDISPSNYLPEDYAYDNDASLRKDEVKGLYPVDNFPTECIDLTNQLSLGELAALYTLSNIAINTENGNMVMSTTAEQIWNVYIPSLTAPEYRLPFRQGSMYKNTAVVENDKKYYPTSDMENLKKEKLDLINADVLFPSVDKIYSAYTNLMEY
jgi:ADP-heptose:LPS heptosyltransferase